MEISSQFKNIIHTGNKAQKITTEDFPGGPVEDSALPLQGAWVRSLVRNQPKKKNKDN